MRKHLTLWMTILIGGGVSLAAYVIVSQVPVWEQQGKSQHQLLQLAIVASNEFLRYWFLFIPVIGLLCYWIAGFLTGADDDKGKRQVDGLLRV